MRSKALVGAFVFATGCYSGVNGGAGSADATASGGTGATGTATGGDSENEPVEPGERLDVRVWRLSPTQFRNEVEAMFGAELPDGTIPGGATVHGISNIAANDAIDADAMDRLIDNLTSTPPAACDTSGMDVPESAGGNSLEDLERLTALHAQVIAQAFACGRARCATLRIGSDYICPQSELPAVQALDLAGAFGGGYTGEWRFHENLVHDYWSHFEHPSFDIMQRAYAIGQVWQTERFVAVLEALDGLLDPLDPSGQSTVLDNTIVYWHNEFGQGPHDSQAEFIPAVVAGGAAGCLKMGRYLRLRQPDGGGHVPHNRLLTSFAMAMGFPDVEFFGDQQLGADPGSFGMYHGELTEIMA